MKRLIKTFLRRLLRFLFESCQKIGFDLLPRSFYSEIPNITALRRSQLWKKPRTMVGVNGVSIEEQLKFLRKCSPPQCAEFAATQNIHNTAARMNGEFGFGPIESDFLYCFMRTVRPKRVVQVGAGVSTAVMLLALNDQDISSEIVAIDPYPNPFLIEEQKKGVLKLRKEGAEETSLEVFTCLESGDFLFVDSTHTVKPGGEVNYLILEVLPRLRKGVYVHFHDICFPYDYTRDILSDGLFFPNESVLLYAFLINNPAYRIGVSLSMLHYAAPDAMRISLPHYSPQANDYGLKITPSDSGHFPSSLYLVKVS